MPPKRRLRKTIDDEALVSCTSEPGVVREEVWEDESGRIVRYNLAFINHFMATTDHGRVLGYDNAHGEPHRHFYGSVEKMETEEYDVLLERFLEEVFAFRKETRWI